MQQLRHAATPGAIIEEKAAPEEDFQPGSQSGSAARHVGGLLYVARGSGPELSYGVGRLARRVRNWRKYDDKALHRMMAYVSGTATHGVEFSVEVSNDTAVLNTYTDADWGGDFETARSTSAHVSGFDGHNALTLAMFGWASKLQTGTP